MSLVLVESTYDTDAHLTRFTIVAYDLVNVRFARNVLVHNVQIEYAVRLRDLRASVKVDTVAAEELGAVETAGHSRLARGVACVGRLADVTRRSFCTSSCLPFTQHT